MFNMGGRLYVPLLVVGICLIAGIDGHRSVSDLLEHSFRRYYERGTISPVLKDVFKAIDMPDFISREDLELGDPRISLFCTTCAAGVNQVLDIVHTSGADGEDVFNKVTQLCIDLGIGNDIFCEGYLEQAEPELIYVLSNTPNNTGNDFCGMYFVGFGCSSRDPDRVWEIELLNTTKPPVVETPYPQISDVPTLKILHLADTHFDPFYEPGSNSKCDEVYCCCRNSSTGETQPGDEAGFWGDYGNCDIPFWTLEVMYQHAAQNHPDIDMIFWIGDHIAHNVWGNTKEGNVQLITAGLDLIEQYFPGIPVFPVLGNHEGHPLNTFAQPYIDEPEFEISWLYDALAAQWTRWLPAETAERIAYGASYSTLAFPGLRIISVNSNYCYGLNWWLILDSYDVSEGLVYLMEQLQLAEDNGEKVYIVQHMSTGSQSCQYSWSHQMNKIVARYESTIVGIFHGHTHYDHFEIYFDPEDSSRAYKVGSIAPSQTTYTELNPGYQVHISEGNFEGSEYRVLDHEVYVLDLNLANAQNDTTMYKLYSSLETYGMPDLSPQSYVDFVLAMNVENSTLFDDFYRSYVKDSQPKLETGCTGNCKSKILCRLLISDNSDHSTCDLIE